MLLERFEDTGLSHYSYAVGCEAAGEIAIVDPRRDIDVYLDFARGRGLRITHVLETHIHADFASGALELAQKTGAQLALSAYDEGETYDVAFPHRELRDGDEIRLGAVRVRALHTPGHTPEHLSFLVFDTLRSLSVPMVLLSGDFLFVGSLGRPDLLGEEAKLDLARRLYRSVRDVLPGLPDGLEVHPGHGAGSMCGAGMSGRPVSTLGFERVANPYLDPSLDEDAFLARILGTVPPFPPYYLRMKTLNSRGPRALGGLPGRTALSADAVAAMVDDGAIVVDLGSQRDFGAAHLPDSLGIGLGNRQSTWAAWVVPPDRPIVLVPRSDAQLEPAIRALVRVGLDDIAGYLEGGPAAWAASGRPLEALPQLDPAELARLRAAAPAPLVLDIRADDEYAAGHIEGASHLMGGLLPQRLADLPADRPIVVACASGYRSTVMGSFLKAAGFPAVYNLAGGMNAWRRAGLPVA